MLFDCFKESTRDAQDLIQRLTTPNGLRYCRETFLLILLVSVGCTPSNHLPSTSPQDADKQAVYLKPSVPAVQVMIEQNGNTEPVPHHEPRRPDLPSPLLTQGERIYKKHCVRCHGNRGNGKGELASSLNPPPLDFTAGVFKFRSTPTGQLPTNDDLVRTVSVGIAGTSMSDYRDLPEQDRRAVVEYVKSLSPRFREEPEGEPIPFPPARAVTPDALRRGGELYTQMLCTACHGKDARGDGPLARSLSDSNGRTIQPADLTKPRLKSGKGPESIYRTFMTGLDGTPMPSYGDSLNLEEAWDLALYVASLSTSGETR